MGTFQFINNLLFWANFSFLFFAFFVTMANLILLSFCQLRSFYSETAVHALRISEKLHRSQHSDAQKYNYGPHNNGLRGY